MTALLRKQSPLWSNMCHAIFSLLFAAVVLLTPLAHSRANDLQVYEGGQPLGIEPYRGSGDVSQRMVSLFCRSLFEFTVAHEMRMNEYRPVIASQLPVIDSAFPVYLRSSIYHYRYIENPKTTQWVLDSLRVTAIDVVTTYKNLINPKSELSSSSHRELLQRYISGMRVVNDTTVMISSKRRSRNILDALTFPVVPASAVGEGAIAANPKSPSAQLTFQQRPWGHGPFAYFGRSEKGGSSSWKFVRAGEGGITSFRNIYVQVLDGANIDVILENNNANEQRCIPEVPLGKQSKVAAGFQKQPLTSPSIELIYFNTTKGFVQEALVRAALSVYLQRTSLMARINNEADSVAGPFPAKTVFYCDTCDTKYYHYDPKLGDELLTRAGWSRDATTRRWTKGKDQLRVKLLSYTGSARSMVTEISNGIVEAWKEAGINAEIEIVDPSEYNRRMDKRNFDAAYGLIDYGITPQLDRYFVSKGSRNVTGFSDRKVDSLWTLLSSGGKTSDVRNIWHQLHTTIAEKVPAAFLWTPQRYAVYSNWITVGQNFYPNNFLGRVEEWKVE